MKIKFILFYVLFQVFLNIWKKNNYTKPWKTLIFF